MRGKVADLLPKKSKERAENQPAPEDPDELVYEEGISATGAGGPIPTEIKRAVILDRAKGIPVRIIARKYEISDGSVSKIWKEFIGDMSKSRLSDEDDPIKFRSRIRKKATDAIEAGLDCDKDPYRQGALGVRVMEGIGEFKGERAVGDVNFNVFVAGVPAEWRDKYLGIPASDIPESQRPEIEGEGREGSEGAAMMQLPTPTPGIIEE